MDIETTLDTSRRLIGEMETLLATARESKERMDELFRSRGLDRQSARAYLEQHPLSAGQRKEVERVLSRLKVDVEDALSEGEPAAPAPPVRMRRNMIRI